ncbi:MAG: 16S rRNA (guanine(527)-N(7))-methyltransferase RsmG [Bacteroidales bacterium]|nr:16S rRNA (guanine(527)-N(7))-methyltransferase RsmG [Bacteroidales bacterium]
MKIISKYFTELTQDQTDRFIQLNPLYSELNEKINVISRRDIENLYERHVLHSLAIARVISFEPGTSVLDAGTGGGFPGIPLAIIFPDVQFHLIDSIGKKIKGVESIIQGLGLKNVTTDQTRLEDLNQKYDFIVSRAVATIPQMLSWSKGLIEPAGFNALPNGMLYLKGGDFSEELKQVGRNYIVYNLSNFFEEEFFETKRLIHLW